MATSFSDRLKQRREQQQEQGGTDFASRVESLRSGKSKTNFGVDENYINRYIQDLESFLNDPSQDYESRYADLTKRRSQIQNYLRSNSYTGDKESASQFSDFLASAQEASQGVLGNKRTIDSFGGQVAYDKAVQNYQNKERVNAMSLDELEEKAKEEKNRGLSERSYNQMIQDRLALGQSADDLIAERDKAAKNAQDRVLYYDDNGNAVTYDRLFREKTAENTWTNLTSDTEAYKLYEKIKEESPEAEAEAGIAGDGTLMASVMADKDVLRQMGYDYDEIAYYQKYKADKEGYKDSIEGADDTNPIKAALFNIASAPLSALEFAENASYSLRSLGSDDSAYGLANIYDDNVRNKSQVMLSTATQMINDWVMDKTNSQLVSWLASGAYSGIVSSAQSAAQVAVCRLLFGDAGTAISLALMSSNAANQQFAESIKSGATNGEALLTSLGAGINEALFEKLSIENLDGINNLIKAQRWQYADFSQFLRTVIQNSPSMLMQGLTEGSEELFTDIANAIWDQYINGSNSEYQRSVKEYMDQGYDSTVAGKMATQKFFGDLVSSFYGGFIGGMTSGGIHVIGDATQLGIQATQRGLQNTIGAASLGRDISSNNNVEALINQANELGDASVSKRAARLSQTENPSNRQIGRLAQEVYAKADQNLAREHQNAYAQEVRSRLGDTENAEQTADIIAKYQRGEFLSSKERKIFAEAKGSDIIEAISNDEEAKARIRLTVEENPEVAKNQERMIQTASLTQVNEKEARSAEGSKSLQAIEDAKRKAKIEKLSAQDAKEETAKSYMDSMGYQQETKDAVMAEIKAIGKDISEIDKFILGVNEAINYGKIGYQQKYIKESGYYGTLTESQKNFAYQLGVDEANRNAVNAQIARDAKLGKMAKKTGAIHYKESVDVDNLNARQKASVEALAYIAQRVTNNNIYFYASTKDEDGNFHVGSDMYGINNFSEGNDSAPNGMYMDGKGDIYIDVNAGNKAEGVILMTASHELTHFIREWSPAKFKTLADFLMDSYGRKGVDVDQLIKAQIEKAKAAGNDLSYEDAYEELVADSMERMLTDEKVYDKILELKAKDESLFNKLHDALQRFIARVKEAYKDLGSQTREGQLVSEMVDDLDRLESLFAEALVDAGNVYGSVSGVEGGSVVDNAYSDTQYSVRPPYVKGQKLTDWVAALSPEARKTYDLFENLHNIGWNNKVDLGLKSPSDIAGRYMTAQTWNDLCEANPKFKKVAKMLSDAIPKEYKASVVAGGKWINDDGTLVITEMEKDLKMKRSLIQRVIDSMPLEKVSSVYEINGKQYRLKSASSYKNNGKNYDNTSEGTMMCVGGDAYRRALLESVRERYRNGELRKRQSGSLAKDTWGALGWLRANQKTTASGDFSTLCPQMFYNFGCWYCYRRAALETNVDNANVGTNVWYTGEILFLRQSDIDSLNASGGLRIQSFGDWFDQYASQLADVIADAATVRDSKGNPLQVKIITKEPSMIEAVAMLKEQGLGDNVYFNISSDFTIEEQGQDVAGEILSRNADRPWMAKKDENGKRRVYWKRALTIEEAYALRKKYPWVNVRIVATTQDEFIQGLKDPRIQVVTGYHGRTKGFTRVDPVTHETYKETEGYTRISSLTGETLVEVEPLGDHGMPEFEVVDGKWTIKYEGANKAQQALAKRILEEGLCSAYYAKSCCTTGNCQQCKTTCGLSNFANDYQEFLIKNAYSQAPETAYWQTHLKGGANYRFQDLLTSDNPTASKILEELRIDEAVKYSFRGENAQNLTDADRKRLDQAKKMLEKGTSMEEIFKKTGWYTQSDGKWRNEIKDEISGVNAFNKNGLPSHKEQRYKADIEKAKARLANGDIDQETYDDLVDLAEEYKDRPLKSGKLPAFLDAPNLYAAYPQLRDVSLFFGFLPPHVLGAANINNNIIELDLDQLSSEPDTTVRESLMHEIQHFIQEYEGFSSGAGLGDSSYWNTGGEIEARDVENRLFKPKNVRKETMPAKFSTRDAEYLELAKDPEKNRAKLQAMVDEEAKKWGAKTEDGVPKAFYHSTNAEFTKFRKGHGILGEGIYFSPYKQNLYGKNVVKAYLKYENGVKFRDVPIDGREKSSSGLPMGIINDFFKKFPEYDAIINRDEEINIKDPSQIKLADPVTYDNDGNVIPLSERFNEKNEDIRYSTRDSSGQELTKAQQEYFKDSKVRDENGNLKRVYHGTGRADRVGTVFRPDRATSGPMAFFTTSKEIADNYARDKKDTSLAYDERYDSYYTQFRVNKNGKDISVPELWKSLSTAEKNRIRDAGKHITYDDDYENIIYDEDAEYGLGNWDDYLLNSHRGNALEALVEAWLEDGELYGDEGKFIEVLKLAGINDVEYLDPSYRDEKTYDTYLNITKPFDAVNEVNDGFIKDYLDWVRKQKKGKYYNTSANADMWDKNNITSDMFAERMTRDIENGTSHAWTSIPDSMSDYLKSLGYDGIKDVGGKNGGEAHTVWIPFYSNQIKNIDNLNPTENEDIRFSNRDPEAVKQLEKVNAQLEKENAKLKEDYAEIKELLSLQSKVTGGKLVKRSSVDALAKRLIKGLDLTGNRTEFTDLLMDAYSYIQGSEDVTWEEVSSRIQNAVEWAKNNQSEGAVVLTPEAKSLLKTIRESRVSLSDKMKADAAHQYGSYNEFRKSMMGKITIANDAPQTLDQLWQELANDHPEYFDPNVSEADMPLLLADAIANIRNEGSEDYYLGQNMMTDQDIFNEIYDGFWDVATLYTVADKAQKEINQLKRKHADRMSDLKESHKEQVAQLKEEAKTRRKELQDRYRERLETQRQTLMSEYRERTNKARERRTATDLRHRITKKINELNTLLLKPDSKHHVPKDMQPYVADALNMLDLDNPRKGEKTRARLNALKDMYKKISETSDTVLHYAYDQAIADMIDVVSEEIGDTPFQKMSVNQLEQVYQMYSAVLATIRNANKTFAYFKKQDIMELSEDVMSEVKKVGGSKEMTSKRMDWLKRNLYWNNMKPIYAMRAIGSETFTKLFENVRRGEDTYARDITEAKNRFETLAKKYGYNDWDLDERFEFKTHDGRKFSLNIMEMMSLYEYYKRPQADAHLAQGGFVFEDNTVKKKNKLGITTEYKLNNANTHRVTPSMMAQIAGKLTAEQKGFADEMQSYLAHEMGAKGNEISEALYDIDLYNEEHYFPLKSSKIYMASKQTETAGDAQIKNMGSSKALVPHANNPIILRGLMDVWVDHVNEMSMYHAFVLPLEDFQRVFNYTTSASGDASPEGVKSAIRNAYGDAANNYIKTMLTDLNGGARADNRAGFMNKLIGTFKKGAVFASASVVIQQPSAIARAWAYIDPKYFAQTTLENLNLKNHSAQWEELKRYAPVAIIKEMGHFDTGLGANTEDWIKQTQPQGFMEKAKALIVDENYRDEILSKAPELADEIAWTHIWNAAKAQVLDQNPSFVAGSEEHLEAAGRLFTDTIVNTQVYDSVLSRSGNMRSNDTGVKMATSFMAEPTTSINMIIDAFTQAKRLGNGREARRIIGSVFAQIILNAALVSLVYAARDDDDDKTYAEKYIGQFASNTLEGINPMTMIPYVKDIVSLLQGYDVERADMSVIADIIQSFRKLMSGEVDSEKVIDFANQIFKVRGVPTQNITRDVRSIYNIAQDIMSDNTTSIEGIRDSILEEVTGKSPSQQYKSRVVKAIKRSDTAKIKSATKEWIDQKVKTGKTEKEAKSAIQSSLTSYYKPLFLKAYQKNDQAEMARIRRALNATGIYKDIVETTQNWIKNSKE